MNDTELEEKIKELKEKEIAGIDINAYSSFDYNRLVEEICFILDDSHFKKLFKAGVITSVNDYYAYKIGNSRNWGSKYDYRKISDGDEFIIPSLKEPNFDSYLVIDKEAETVGLLCQSNRPLNQDVLIFASTFYFNMEPIKDFEGNFHSSKVIGMKNLGHEIKVAKAKWERNQNPNYPPSKIDHLIAKTKKLCELAGARKFKVNIFQIDYLNTNQKLTTTSIYEYHLLG